MPMVEQRAVIVIVNWRGWRDTLECLESVFQSDYQPFQVIVCDNDSGDTSVDRIREWAQRRPPAAGAEGNFAAAEGELPIAPGRQVHESLPLLELTADAARSTGFPAPSAARLILLHAGENRGFAGGNNVAIRFILTDPEIAYVWLLNNDTVIAPGALRELIATAAAGDRVGAVGSKVFYHHDPERIQAAGGGRYVAWQAATRYAGEGGVGSRSENAPTPPDYITGSSMLVPAMAFRSVGLFDESYFLYYEEVDWCLRARRAGWRLAYAPLSVVWHKEGSSVGRGSPRADYYSTRNALLITRKLNPHLLPFVAVYTLYRNLIPKLLRVQPVRAGAVLRGFRDFLLGHRGPEVPGRPGHGQPDHVEAKR
jgi:GT2 family glycosyltransferase